MKIKRMIYILAVLPMLLIFLTGCGTVLTIGRSAAYHEARILPKKVEQDKSIILAYITSTTLYGSPKGFAPDYFPPYVSTKEGAGTAFEIIIENVDTKKQYTLFRCDDFKDKYPLSLFQMSKALPLGTYIFKEIIWIVRDSLYDKTIPFTGDIISFTIKNPGDIIYIGEYIIPEPGSPQIYRLTSNAEKEKLKASEKNFEKMATTDFKFENKEKIIKELWTDFKIDEMHALLYFYGVYKYLAVYEGKNIEWKDIARNKLEKYKDNEGYKEIEEKINLIDKMSK
jgi:hypothetical protein